MRVFKGTNRDMVCTHGRGEFQYVLGRKMTAKEAKTVSTGLHANEYVLDCMKWYSLRNGRFFLCTAGGSIDEEGEQDWHRKPGEDTKIACTELTLDCELGRRGIAMEAILYMAEHPGRSWERKGDLLDVGRDYATADEPGAIAIARGRHPVVKAAAGAVVGLVREDEDGSFADAACFEAACEREYSLGDDAE